MAQAWPTLKRLYLNDFSARLLDWYDAHRRDLPWRSDTPDAYAVWLSEIMLQQTTVAAVMAYYRRFLTRWPDVRALAAVEDAEVMREWAGLGYYSRARNFLAAARMMAAEGFPVDEAGWRQLPGVGRYTAAAVAAIALGQRAVVVDGNVKRVVARLFIVETPLPAEDEIYRLTDAITPGERAGDFAQAMMDLGATVCTPRSPKCLLCPVRAGCRAYRQGNPTDYPRRSPKKARPERTATAWWIERGEGVALVRRPPKGLLGGMLGLPVSEDAGAGERLGQVTHVFTHFRLTLDVRRGTEIALDGDVEWWPRETLDEAGLPTLFRKAVTIAMQEDANVRSGG
ncbi:Adenine DNA glycosylase [Sphingomonas antarctica]|uniref:A/G-specific adenine glycosylase n=1 Tax=Sphingomonas antarctica TaxID=2040274 RepID=UPI0039E98D49